MVQLIIAAVVAYLIGSIPFGYILVKIFLKQDIRQTGSGNIGATNVARSGNKGLAIATLLLDAGKGAVAVYLALIAENWSITGPDDSTPLFSATAFLFGPFFAVLGHCFPVWLRFKGGKGVATAAGAFAVISPPAVLVAMVAFAVIFAATRYVSLGSIAAAAVFPVALYIKHPAVDAASALIYTAAPILIIAKHHGNIRRLVAGTEPKFGAKAIGTNDPGAMGKSI